MRGAVTGVGEPAAVERQTSAADALGEPELEALELGDSVVDPRRPRGRETGPVADRLARDEVYDRKHAYLADGFSEEWLGHLERLRRELPADASLHIGHGGPVTPAHFDLQREYVETFVDALRSADWSQPDTARAAVVEWMTRLLPTDELQFLMELSIDPVAARLGVAQAV